MRILKLSFALIVGLLLHAAWADELIMPKASPNVEPKASGWTSDDKSMAAESANDEEDADADTTESTTAQPPDDAPADARVDTKTVITDTPAPVVAMPRKGETMAEVTKAFGQPKTKHKPTGGDSPRQPVITRWDYENFSVVFEKNKVVNSINPQQPPKLQHADKLKPLEY